jgi:hypothetical protein
MAVNAHEQAQVGHYYLLRREYEEAWRWYERAAAGRETPRPIKLSELDQFLRRIRIHNDSTFFEYYCLTKLGRDDEAAVRLEQFRTAMSFELDIEEMHDLDDQWQGREEEVREELGKLVTFATPLIHSAYITEVYLSLDATHDGITFFERELEAATTDPERLAALLCLSQLLLIANDHDAYAELATSKLAPLLMEMIESPTLMPDIDFTNLPKLRRSIEDFTILAAGGAALGPLASEAFLAAFSEEQLRRHLADWQELGRQVQCDAGRLRVDSVLAALLKQLGDDEYQEIEARMKANPFNGTFEFSFFGPRKTTMVAVPSQPTSRRKPLSSSSGRFVQSARSGMAAGSAWFVRCSFDSNVHNDELRCRRRSGDSRSPNDRRDRQLSFG